MPRKITTPDLVAGLLLIAAGALGLWFNQEHAIGTARRMGAGYMPMLAFGATFLLGLSVALRALAGPPAPLEAARIRPLIGLGTSVAFFAVAIQPLGLVVTVIGTVLLSALATTNGSWRMFIAASFVLTIISVLIFVVGLRVRVSVWPATIF